MPQPPSPPRRTAIRREDYTPPDWLVPEIGLDFQLDPAMPRASPRKLTVRRQGAHGHPLRLNGGDGLTPLSVSIDGEELHDAGGSTVSSS
jgi:aminopeptidase N